MQCNAKSKRSGQQCKKDAVIGSSKCHIHGGKTPRGVASPNLRHGQYSRYLSGRLVSRYEEALDAAQIDHQIGQIALLDARVAELLQRLDHGESWEAWNNANEALTQFKAALKVNDQEQAGYWLAELEKAIRMGRNDFAAWHEITELIEGRRKLIESERRQGEKAGRLISLEEAGLLISAVFMAMKKHVQDRATLAALTAEIERLTLLPGP